MGESRHDLVGQTVDGYRVEEVLGVGGTGVVYRAVPEDGGDAVALKVLQTKHAKGGDAAVRFLREAELERLRHPNIVEVRAAGALADGCPYLMTELLHGETLETKFAREGRLPVDEGVRIVLGILEGLHAAHRAGVVHRDVKPANVFLADVEGEDAPRVKLLDFSIARFADPNSATVTASGDIVGTPLYLAPEQATGIKQQDGRIDVWASGVLLYHLLTGEPPFASKQLAALILKVVSEEPPPAHERREEIGPAISSVIWRALRKARDDRYASAKDMAAALREAALVRS